MGHPFQAGLASQDFWGTWFLSLYICRYRRISAYMGRLLFDLTDDDRALLEAHRVRLGLRSHAETLRSLIRRSGKVLAATAVGPIERGDLVTLRDEPIVAGIRQAPIWREGPVTHIPHVQPVHVEVPILARKTFNPQPKRGK